MPKTGGQTCWNWGRARTVGEIGIRHNVKRLGLCRDRPIDVVPFALALLVRLLSFRHLAQQPGAFCLHAHEHTIPLSASDEPILRAIYWATTARVEQASGSATSAQGSRHKQWCVRKLALFGSSTIRSNLPIKLPSMPDEVFSVADARGEGSPFAACAVCHFCRSLVRVSSSAIDLLYCASARSRFFRTSFNEEATPELKASSAVSLPHKNRGEHARWAAASGYCQPERCGGCSAACRHRHGTHPETCSVWTCLRKSSRNASSPLAM